MLTYDTGQNGYVIDLDKAMLEKAPSYRDGSEPWQQLTFGEQVNSYYGVPIAPVFI